MNATSPRRRKLGDLDWDHAAEPSEKKQYVSRMFDVIAPRYDLFTRLFSYGMDSRWKRELVDNATDHGAKRVADIACGTGDFLDAIVRQGPLELAVGVDLAMGMARRAYTRTRAHGGSAIIGDMAQLPLASTSLSLIAIGYGFRNAPDLATALGEVSRVLAPGGRLLVLDFYRPSRRLWQFVFVNYLRVMGTIFGLVLHGEGAVYRYIGDSVAHHVTIAEFEHALANVGLQVHKRYVHLLGAICVHVAEKVNA